MTDDRMALADLIEKDADIDLVREMFALDDARLMEVEVEEVTGRRSGPERRPERRIATFTRSADGRRGSGALIWRSRSCAEGPACTVSSIPAGLRRSTSG